MNADPCPDFDTETALFESREAAVAAANAALPRRKHNRPYALMSGYFSHRAGADRWIVLAPSNGILLRDGQVYDHMRRKVIR